MSAILAKSSGETLSQHTIRCIEVADILLNKLPFEEQLIERLRNDLYLALAIHDVGKAAIGFQKMLKNPDRSWGHRHEILSTAFASSLELDDEILLAILTHHKPLPIEGLSEKDCLPYEEIPWPTDLTPIWNEMAEEWNSNIELFVKEWSRICNFIRREDLIGKIKLSPISISKDWFGRRQVERIPFERRYYASLLRGILINSDHLASNENLDTSLMSSFIPSLASFQLVTQELRNFQKRSARAIGHLILRAPTGSGKTIAALLWAQKNQKKNGRLFYVLPNIASINAMYKRLQDLLGRDNVGLLHSRAASSLYSFYESDGDLSSKIQNQNIARMLASLAKAMWFPFRVCTPHQILRYSLQGKGWESMLSEFPNSCFIFDEIHAYDPTITGLTVATAKYLAEQNASCMFLSATMPTFLRKILEQAILSIQFIEPSANDSADRQVLQQKRHDKEILDGDVISNIEYIVKEAEKASSTLVICNHVPTAQKVYKEISKKLSNTILLHSRFCRRDRDKIEMQLTQSTPKILISTQVVEVSLDIDFEQGFSEPAPIDALIQRFGRINRYARHPPAPVRIFTKQVNRYPIYDEDLVRRSLQEFVQLTNPLGESDLVEAADRVYVNGYNDDDKFRYEQAINHPLIRDFQKNLIAGIHRDWVKDVVDSPDGTIDILPKSLVSEFERYEASGLILQAYNLLVPVRIRSIHALKDYIDKSYDPWIIKRPYSETLGLDLDIDTME